jgi:hypothetical protein
MKPAVVVEVVAEALGPAVALQRQARTAATTAVEVEEAARL